MPRVLSNLRDQHSSNYTMSWHTAHAALEPNGSILPLAEISTGEEGREGSRTRSAKAIGARGFWARLCSCSGQYSSCDHSEAQGQVQSGEGRAPLSSSSHRELQAKSKDRVATRLVLGTTDHHSHVYHHSGKQHWREGAGGFSLATDHLPSMCIPGF